MFISKYAELDGGNGFAECRVRQRLSQIGNQPRLVVLGENLQVEPERGVRCPQQHLHRQRSLVVFELVEVAQRNPEPLRQRSLGQVLLLAQALQPQSHERLFHLTLDFANFAKA